jgi:hypothetical protein
MSSSRKPKSSKLKRCLNRVSIRALRAPFLILATPHLARKLYAMISKNDIVEEAIVRLGLLRPEAVQTIELLLQGEMIEHPRAICTTYRKNGAQISPELKKELGIRANGFLSVKAFDELTAKGQLEPLAAHEKTLLRATFSLMRYKSIQQESRLRDQLGPCFIGFKYDVQEMDCEACVALDGSLTTASSAAILPLKDCVCVTAHYSL